MGRPQLTLAVSWPREHRLLSPEAPPSSRRPSPMAPCLPHPIFLVFFISISLRCPVLLPGAFSRRRCLSGMDWLWDLCCHFLGGRVSSPRSPAPGGVEGGSDAVPGALAQPSLQALISLLRPTGIPHLAVPPALVLHHLYWTN